MQSVQFASHRTNVSSPKKPFELNYSISIKKIDLIELGFCCRPTNTNISIVRQRSYTFRLFSQLDVNFESMLDVNMFALRHQQMYLANVFFSFLLLFFISLFWIPCVRLSSQSKRMCKRGTE